MCKKLARNVQCVLFRACDMLLDLNQLINSGCVCVIKYCHPLFMYTYSTRYRGRSILSWDFLTAKTTDMQHQTITRSSAYASLLRSCPEKLNVVFYAIQYMRDQGRQSNLNEVLEHYELNSTDQNVWCARHFHTIYPDFDVNVYVRQNVDLNQLNVVQQTMHYITHGEKEGRAYPRREVHTHGINLSGHVRGCFGLAENPRSVYRSLHVFAKSVGVAVNEITCPWHKYNYNFEGHLTDSHPYPVNVICVNWNEQGWKTQLPRDYFTHKVNICLWAFETERILPWVVKSISDYNGVLTISKYCARAVRESMNDEERTRTPVWPVEIPVSGTTSVYDCSKAEAIKKLSVYTKVPLPDDVFLCLFVFDYFSSEYRKNATGALTAFDTALGGVENAYFVMKTINDSEPDRARVEQHILNLTRPDKIIVISEHLDQNIMNILYRSSSLFISLHRAEGQGLGMMRTIGDCIPTIVTNYSGNTDFCHTFNSFLVNWKYTAIPENDVNYRQYSDLCKWAEPDIAHATQLILHVHDNYEESCRRVEAAKDYIQTKYNYERFGRQIYGLIARNMPKPPHSRLVFLVHVGTRDTSVISELFMQSQRASVRHACAYYINVAEGQGDIEFVRRLWRHTEHTIITTPNVGKDSMGCARNLVQCVMNNDTDASLYIVLQTKTDNDWRRKLIHPLLDPKSIDSLLRYDEISSSCDSCLGIAASQGTICPLYNDRDKTVELANYLNVDISHCLRDYDDTTGAITINGVRIERDTEGIDTDLYKEVNLDLHHMDSDQLTKHYLHHGKQEKRIAHRHIYERLTYSRYPIVAYGGTYAMGRGVMKHIAKHADRLECNIIPKIADEIGNVTDVSISTYTHAFERLLSCVACALNMPVVQVSTDGVLLHVR